MNDDRETYAELIEKLMGGITQSGDLEARVTNLEALLVDLLEKLRDEQVPF